MMVNTKLGELQETLAQKFHKVGLKGDGASSFVNAIHTGRAVEISEDNGGFWLEFWEKSDDEDAAPVSEKTVDSGERAIQEATKWLA